MPVHQLPPPRPARIDRRKLRVVIPSVARNPGSHAVDGAERSVFSPAAERNFSFATLAACIRPQQTTASPSSPPIPPTAPTPTPGPRFSIAPHTPSPLPTGTQRPSVGRRTSTTRPEQRREG